MNTFIHIAGWTLVHFAWQGTIIALVAALALRLLPRTASHARYALVCATLVTMLVSPLVTAQLVSNFRAAASFNRASQISEQVITSTAPVRLSSDAPTWVVSGSKSFALPSADTTLPLVVTIWLMGVMVLLIRLAGGWWRIRHVHLAALAEETSRWHAATQTIARRLGLARTIHVVDSSLVRTPTVVGWLRPVILLPIAALASLTPAQVDAILAHELAHIRRHDFIVNVLQTIAETVLFYHPAVWWVSSKIRAEREHCCDEIAVNVCGDAVGYAAALAELETWRTESSTLALAATGGSLLERVKRVLGVRAHDTPRIGSATTIVAFVLVFVVAAGTLQFMFTLQPLEATAVVPDRKVTDAHSAVAWRMVFDHPTGQMSFKGFTGQELIRFAYQLPGSRIVGAPDWIDAETFDLSTTLAHEPAAAEMPRLVRQLLEERFDLVTHEETRDFPVYALVIDRADGALGTNLQLSTSDCWDQRAWMKSGAPSINVRGPSTPIGAGRFSGFCVDWTNSPTGISADRITMTDLAEFLSRPGPALDRPVVDRTNVEGQFDLKLDVFMPAIALMGQYPRLVAALEPLGFQSLRTALREQLGLRLEPATAEGSVLVIDRAERPSLTAAAQQPRDTIYKASDGVVLPVPLKKVQPDYPASAKQTRTQGTVIVTLMVLPDGTINNVRVSKPVNAILDDEAVKAVRQWRFRPGTKDGTPVAVEVSIEMGFSLRGPTYKAGTDGVSLPVPIKEVKPEYPETEKNAGIQGVVTVEAVVMPDGTVGNTSVISPLDPALDEQALQAIKQWQFKPGMKDGEPVPVRVAVEMSFGLR